MLRSKLLRVLRRCEGVPRKTGYSKNATALGGAVALRLAGPDASVLLAEEALERLSIVGGEF